jgi:SAM-dependent methyltransferase
MKRESSWKDIYAINLRLGLSNILKGIDYSRLVEYPLAYSQLELGKKDLILDVGSSDSIFPIFLASLGHKVHAIDIDQKVMKLQDYASKLGTPNLLVSIQDVTKLRYPDGYFDKITVISSIEHVLPIKDGDVKAIREISRALRIEGQVIVTVPYGDNFETKWSHSKMSGNSSLMRKYDETAVSERLVKPSSLILERRIFFGESVEFSKIWYNSPFSFFGFPAPLLAKFFMGIRNPRKLQGVCLSFRKHEGPAR